MTPLLSPTRRHLLFIQVVAEPEDGQVPCAAEEAVPLCVRPTCGTDGSPGSLSELRVCHRRGGHRQATLHALLVGSAAAPRPGQSPSASTAPFVCAVRADVHACGCVRVKCGCVCTSAYVGVRASVTRKPSPSYSTHKIAHKTCATPLIECFAYDDFDLALTRTLYQTFTQSAHFPIVWEYLEKVLNQSC